MITIFSIPKPFRGHIGVIQRNAIGSWVRLDPDVEVVLLGDEPGMAEAATDFGVRWERQIECNEHGTPLLSSAFSRAEFVARHELICYVNADIILLSDFGEVVRRTGVGRHMLVGQRWDLDVRGAIDFEMPDWEERLRAEVAARGLLHPPCGIDYFVFSRGMGLGDLPPFAVGRAGWDNWMIFNARKRRCQVLDATEVTTVVHQNHNYEHVPERKTATYQQAPESEANIALAGDRRLFNLRNATHRVTQDGVRRVFRWPGLSRWLRQSALLYPRLAPVFRTAYRLGGGVLRAARSIVRRTCRGGQKRS